MPDGRGLVAARGFEILCVREGNTIGGSLRLRRPPPVPACREFS
jgi:hypothetical protein